jgi:hypothetical protein
MISIIDSKGLHTILINHSAGEENMDTHLFSTMSRIMRQSSYTSLEHSDKKCAFSGASVSGPKGNFCTTLYGTEYSGSMELRSDIGIVSPSFVLYMAPVGRVVYSVGRNWDFNRFQRGKNRKVRHRNTYSNQPAWVAGMMYNPLCISEDSGEDGHPCGSKRLDGGRQVLPK